MVSRLKEEYYFKAFRKGRFRKLSNLFGPVEWKYQQAKFKESSEVHAFLEKGLQATMSDGWTREKFSDTLDRMGQAGKVDSYVDEDGSLATGLVAQMTSLIAREPKSPLARKRLTFIMGKSKMLSEEDAVDWHGRNVHPPLTDSQTEHLMYELLQEKYAIPEYRELLLDTGDATLHESKGRGAPNKWEWQRKPLTPLDKEKGYTRGGDLLGTLLMRLRSEIRSQRKVYASGPSKYVSLGPRVAHCFLLYTTIANEKMWKEYFRPCLPSVRVYAHLKEVTADTPSWLAKRNVDTVETDWCSESMVVAFLRMFKKGLECLENTHFCLLSGSCIPLRDGPTTVSSILSLRKSCFFMPEIRPFRNDKETRGAYTWCILTRRDAETMVRLIDPDDSGAQEYLRRIRRKYGRARAEGTWRTWCEDETIPVNWMLKNRADIENRMTTFVEFETDDAPHPIVWTTEHDKDRKVDAHSDNFRVLTPEEVRRMKSTSYFARKFTHAAARMVHEAWHTPPLAPLA